MVQQSLPKGSGSGTPRRIVLTAFGSLGDLHPYIAVALGLKERGHDAVLVTGECYRRKVESLGLGFRPLRPDSDFVSDPETMRRVMHPRWGTVRVVRDLLFPVLRQSYEDTLDAANGADLLASHPATGWATRLVAEKTGLRWASTMITPLGFFSAYDLPVMPAPAAVLNRLHFLGPRFLGPLLRLGQRATRFLARPWYRLRAEIGLPPTDEANPLADSHSPLLVLALFSGLLAAKQPDWPPQTVLTGFPLYDRDTGLGLPSALARFLDDGPPPLVFTLGISAAMVAGTFFRDGVAAQRPGPKGSVGRREEPAEPRGIALPRRVLLRLRPLLRIVPSGGGRRPRGRHRHHRAGDTVGPSVVGGAVLARSAGQRRASVPAWRGPDDLLPPLHCRVPYQGVGKASQRVGVLIACLGGRRAGTTGRRGAGGL